MTNLSRETIVSAAAIMEAQAVNQQHMLNEGMYDGFKQDKTLCVPIDDVNLSSYHVQQLVSEVGEVLECDKRWKNMRNGKYDRDEKLEELADCAIVVMNIAMFSGFSGEEFFEAIAKKIDKVHDRIIEESTRC